MARGKRQGIVIAGGGLAGSLAALAMAKLRPEVPVLLMGEEERFGGGQSWTFLDEELTAEERALLTPLIGGRWPGFYVAFPGLSRKLKLPCSAIVPKAIDRTVRAALGEKGVRAGVKIVAVRDDSVILQDGEKIAAEGAIDAREATNLSMLELGWRLLAARDLALGAPHRVDRPVLADATVESGAQCRFAACLPLREDRLCVEDVTLSATPDIDAGGADARIAAYVEARGWRAKSRGPLESAALPLALGGDFAGFWRFGGARVAKFGARGGYFHPATGSPIGDAVRTALLLARQKSFAGGALHDLFEKDALALWARRDFYRGLNRALLAGGAGCEALRRLYELDPALLGRFQSERLGLLDRRRIMAAVSR
jgi:lycopene beta-cyclase